MVAERPENGPRPGAGGHTDDEGQKWAKIVGEEIFSGYGEELIVIVWSQATRLTQALDKA